ncbi:hypothetical protein CL629_00995 [bacterium]|nr:hypothetical protein [bacterium]|tara:strand:- start:2810 stop:3826 length:1017 start_codon:yes stop_codon:yes gene_type:complete
MKKLLLGLIILACLGTAGGMLLRVIFPDAIPENEYIISSPKKETQASLPYTIGEPKKETPQKPQEEIVSLTLSSKSLEQGDTLIVTAYATSKPNIQIENTPLTLIPIEEKQYIGIYGIDVRKEPGEVSIQLQENTLQEKTIQIRERAFPVTELALSKEQKEQGYTPSAAVQDIAQNDTEILYTVLDNPLPEIFFKKPFIYPLPTQEIAGGFGNIRKSGNSSIRHLGVDLDAKKGDPVYASNDGVVRLARTLKNFGNTIVIDHGASIFSLYLHLDTMEVQENETITQEKIIGTVGNTGLYTLDHHLHFSIKTGGASVDPLRFVETTQKWMLPEKQKSPD